MSQVTMAGVISGWMMFRGAARSRKQPRDGSCLYHALSCGLGQPNGSRKLRRSLATYLRENPNQVATNTLTLEDLLRADSNLSVNEYARRQAKSGWGGGVEMAACSLMMKVDIHVYQVVENSSDFIRISCFDSPNAVKTINVLYQGPSTSFTTFSSMPCNCSGCGALAKVKRSEQKLAEVKQLYQQKYGQEVDEDVAEDLPVVEKGGEEEIPAEPEDGAFSEQAYDEHTQGLSHEERQTFQDVAEGLPVVEKGACLGRRHLLPVRWISIGTTSSAWDDIGEHRYC
eukprot:symbB.v1.2.038012.t2/scaffold5779.1/size23665/1